MREQKFIEVRDGYAQLDTWLDQAGIKRILLVCGKSVSLFKINDYFIELEEEGRVVRFSEFKPNPTYESVVEGVRRFHAEKCDGIIAVGGGSAMDVAKCIKLYSNLDDTKNYLEQFIVTNDIPLAVMPTTAGTGSEATRFAVIYYRGEKQSVMHESAVPSVVILDPSTLNTLPEYQRKSTMLDAFCHAVESFWSVNSTEESKDYSRQALKMILANMELYMRNTEDGNTGMLKAAYMAGKAINIAQTTAGHAMCYKLTSIYGIAHGHAAALCVSCLWEYMLAHLEDCIDYRGEYYLYNTFAELGRIMGCEDAECGAEKFADTLASLHMLRPVAGNKDIELLGESVNTERLKNNPIRLNREVIKKLYREMLKEEKQQHEH